MTARVAEKQKEALAKKAEEAQMKLLEEERTREERRQVSAASMPQKCTQCTASCACCPCSDTDSGLCVKPASHPVSRHEPKKPCCYPALPTTPTKLRHALR